MNVRLEAGSFCFLNMGRLGVWTADVLHVYWVGPRSEDCARGGGRWAVLSTDGGLRLCLIPNRVFHQ